VNSKVKMADGMHYALNEGEPQIRGQIYFFSLPKDSVAA
jgi:hypothetical protein